MEHWKVFFFFWLWLELVVWVLINGKLWFHDWYLSFFCENLQSGSHEWVLPIILSPLLVLVHNDSFGGKILSSLVFWLGAKCKYCVIMEGILLWLVPVEWLHRHDKSAFTIWVAFFFLNRVGLLLCGEIKLLLIKL